MRCCRAACKCANPCSPQTQHWEWGNWTVHCSRREPARARGVRSGGRGVRAEAAIRGGGHWATLMTDYTKLYELIHHGAIANCALAQGAPTWRLRIDLGLFRSPRALALCGIALASCGRVEGCQLGQAMRARGVGRLAGWYPASAKRGRRPRLRAKAGAAELRYDVVVARLARATAAVINATVTGAM